MENSDITSTIDLVIPETDYYIEDYIVPGAIGYFDINVDSTDVSVRFKYTITCSPSETNNISDLKPIGYSLNGNNDSIIYLTETNSTIENYLLSYETTSSIRVYVKWIDDSTEILNDTADTDLSQDQAIGKLDVNVKFEQRQ